MQVDQVRVLLRSGAHATRENVSMDVKPLWTCQHIRLKQCREGAMIYTINDTYIGRAHCAAGRSTGSIAVPSVDYSKPGNFGAVSLARSSQGETVPLVTIDSLALPSCHLIKIDVEGMEIDVLEGAKNTLQQFRPLLYVENDQPEKSPPLIAHLLAQDYRLYWLEPPLYRSDNFFGDAENIFESAVSADMVCVPRTGPLAIRTASKSLRPIQNVRAVTRAHRRADWMTVPNVKWCLLALLAVFAAPAQAQTFPTKTIRIIVPYAPGGSIDLTARLIAKNLQDSVGQSVIVENKPGANAAIGIETLLRSEPDGHTLAILSDSAVTINVHLS